MGRFKNLMFQRFLSKAQFSSRAEQVLAKGSGTSTYNSGMQFFHWASGSAILACLGLVQYKQSLPANTDDEKKELGRIMMYHKSFGLIVTGLYFPRVVARLISRKPPGTGGAALSALAAVNHYAMYALVMTMCGTGVGMGI